MSAWGGVCNVAGIAQDDGLLSPWTPAACPGTTLIKSEHAYLNNIVYVDVRGRDVGGYVQDARAMLERELKLPPGYRLEWAGQFEAMG